MKKKLFVILFIFLLWGIGGFAQTYSSVVVTPITANYAATPPTVTFEVYWPGGTRDAVTHRSKVWLLVDYRRVLNNAYTGGWLRAGISSAHTPTTTAGSTVSLVPSNTKGFWLQGSDGAFAATVTVPVTVDLTGYDYKFGWCGVASDRPPYAEEKTGSYTLHGTPPFIIQTHPTDASQTITEHTTAYNDCIYALTDATGAPGDTPLPAITDFTASTTSICAGQSVTLTATAPGAERYSFDDGLTWGNNSSTVVSPLTTTAYILKASREKGGCTVTSPTTITVTVHGLPTITLSSANSAQTVTAGVAIPEIKYTTANASGATVTGLPDGVTGSWASDTYTISGTPTVSGTYNYTVTTTNSNGCTDAPATGTITVNYQYGCIPSSLTLGSVGFTSSQIWTAGTITVSAPVTVTYCGNRNTSAYNGGSSGAWQTDCCANAYDRQYGDYVSWCFAQIYAAELCPSPWHLPTEDEWCYVLNQNMNCSGELTGAPNGWGWWYGGGFGNSPGYMQGNNTAEYWSYGADYGDTAHHLTVRAGQNRSFINNNWKLFGFMIRCVK